MSTRTPTRPPRRADRARLAGLAGLADRRPLALAAVAFGTGVAALVVSVPPITVAATQPTYLDPYATTSADPARR